MHRQRPPSSRLCPSLPSFPLALVRVLPRLVLPLLVAMALVGGLAWPAHAQTPQTLVRLPGHVLPALANATKLTSSATPSTAAGLAPNTAARTAPTAGGAAGSQPITLTFVLKRTDEQGFERYLAEVQDPLSPNHDKFLTQQQLADRFGPSQSAYNDVLRYLQGEGFTLVQGSTNRLTLTVSGTRAQAEQAFALSIDDYQLGSRNFFANDQDPALPNSIARTVQAVVGLSDLARPGAAPPSCGVQVCPSILGDNGFSISGAIAQWLILAIKAIVVIAAIITGIGILIQFEQRSAEDAINNNGSFAPSLTPPEMAAPPPVTAAAGGGPPDLAPLGPDELSRLLDRAGAPTSARASAAPAIGQADPPGGVPWLNVTGAGEKIGLLEFDTFNPSDVSNWLNLIGLPASQINQLSKKDVNGGIASPGPGESEVLADLASVMLTAPGASYVVYDSPFAGICVGCQGSFQTALQAMLNDPAGPPNVITNSWVYCEDMTYPGDVQSIDSILAQMAASGISFLTAADDNGSACMDGSANTVAVPADAPNATAVGATTLTFGPGLTYQSEQWWGYNGGGSGFGVSKFFSRPSYQNGFTTASGRSVPDVVIGADPNANPIMICQADAGGCPTGAFYGGTSVAAPEWAGFVADLDQAQGAPVGGLNAKLYPLENSGAFHTPPTMLAPNNDFAHVGLGSPNFNRLNQALSGTTPGPVSTQASMVQAIPEVAATGGLNWTVDVWALDANGDVVPGKTIALSKSTGSNATISPASETSAPINGAVAFAVSDSTPETVTFTATDTTDGITLGTATISFVAPPATSGGIGANPSSVPADGTSTTTITVTQLTNSGGAAGKTVSISQGSGHSTITATGATPGVTDSTGKATFTATDTTAETVTYTATDVTDRLPIPGSAQVVFGSGTGGSPPCSNGTPAAGSGWSVSAWATGFPVSGCVGPLGLAFDAAGHLLAGDPNNGAIYNFGPAGGAATTPINSTPIAGGLLGLTFSKDGHLYAVRRTTNDVVEIDPTTGAVIREVVSGSTSGVPSGFQTLNGIATDPISGDLFVTSGPSGGVWRISNFSSGTDTATVTEYAATGDSDGIAFTADGSWMFVANGPGNGIWAISGTNSAQPGTITLIANGVFLFHPDGIALASNPANPGNPPYVVVNQNDGEITEVDLSWTTGNPPSVSSHEDIYSGGSRGDFVSVGPDGCMYATQTDAVLKITRSDGSCPFAPSGTLPSLSLAPSTVSPNPMTGTQATFTATLHNIASPAGTQITFTVTGANPQTKQVAADANGVATFTYTGARTGADTVVARATVGTTPLTSAPASVTWGAGKDVSFLTLNGSATTGAVGQSVPLQATLTDVSATTPVPIVGATVALSLQGNSCNAVTNANGVGTCNLTPAGPAASYPLTATYAGSSQYTASNASVPFLVTNLSVTATSYTGPTTLTNGSSATLSGTLSLAGGGPLANKSVSFTLGSGAGAQSCLGTTNSNGVASCSISSVNQTPGSDTVTVAFAGDANDAAQSLQAAVTVNGVQNQPTQLTYTGPSSGDYHDSVSLTATLLNTAGTPSTPVAGQSVSFSLGTQSCSGTTDGTGKASCSLTLSQPPGSTAVSANFAGGGGSQLSSSAPQPFTIAKEETALTLASPAGLVLSGGQVTVAARLLEDGSTPPSPSGQSVTFTATALPARDGDPDNYQPGPRPPSSPVTATGTLDSTGLAQATLSLPVGAYTLSASFAGDADYRPSSATAETVYVAQPTQFVIWGGNPGGPLPNLSVGQPYAFWGQDWFTRVAGGGYSAGADFWGLAASVSGTSWTAQARRANPPGLLPAYIEVLVATQISETGKTVTGNVAALAVLRVNPGYSPDPDHVATGTLVAVLPLGQQGQPGPTGALAPHSGTPGGSTQPGFITLLHRLLGRLPR